MWHDPVQEMQMKVAMKKNRTNNKRAEYHGVQLGHSKSTGNPNVSPFQGKDARVMPDSPNPSGTRHSQADRAQGASPHRVRLHPGTAVNHGGSHVKNATKE
jgi:hypothetical protein